jgi:aquaporin Z
MAATPTTSHRLAAEFLGTFVLVFGGCGAAVLAGQQIGWLGVSLAFGLTVLAMAFAVGHISGGHFNPAVTLGLAAAKRFAWKDAVGYIATQIVAATAAAAVLYVIASGKDGFSAEGAFATNGYADRSPDGYSLLACLVAEFVLTAIFLYVIIGVTDPRGVPAGFAPIAIGLALTLIHLVSIPVTNTSVNPARSIGPALFAGPDAIGQLWLFVLAPIAGALLAGFSYVALVGKDTLD